MNAERSQHESRSNIPANILLLGLPGSGKTTLGELMASESSNMEYISIGQISRDLPTDDVRRKYVDNLYHEYNRPVGDPSFFVELARTAIREALSDGKGIILDGLPKKIEEVEPLNALLEDEGVKIDGVVMCEVSPFTALRRVIERGEREGGLDGIGTAVNRGDMYWKSVDEFKSKLGGFLGARLITVDTENMDPRSAMEKASSILEEIRAKEANATVLNIVSPEVAINRQIIDDLYENIHNSDTREIQLTLSKIIVDDENRKLINELLENESQNDIENVVAEVFKAKSEFINRPLSAERYAGMFIRNIYEPLKQLSIVIPEEARLRSRNQITPIILEKVVEEVLVAKQVIDEYQSKANKIKNADEFVSEEIKARNEDITHTEAFLKEANVLQDGMTLRSLMMLQPRYWNIFTSSDLVGSLDGNYQKRINSKPGAHHSLSVPMNLPRSLIANSINEYQPFIEAVSTSERSGFDTSLGFLHVIGTDSTGRAYQVEWPLMMQDSRLAAHSNPLLRDMLARGQGIYFNHDFWHNIVPVYAESFNLYHPHAPIAYGGLLPSYEEFGKDLRSEKEEYEIFVARCHAEAQQYRMKHDPAYKRSQIDAALTIISDIPYLKQQLMRSDGLEFAENTAQYFLTVTVGRLLNVFPPDSPDLEPLIDKLNSHPDLSHKLSKDELMTLLFTQRMILASKDSKLSFMQDLFSLDVDEEIRQTITEHLLTNINNYRREPSLTRDMVNDLCKDEKLVDLALKYVEPENELAESGADALYSALHTMGVTELIQGEKEIELRGLDLLRWLAIVAPQRDPLKGHMEKVHGKKVLKFGKGALPATEIVKKHADSIMRDRDIYEYRKWAREFGQALSLDIYNLLFDDNQDTSKDQRTMINILSNYNRSKDAHHNEVNSGIRSLDRALDDLVNATYLLSENDVSNIEKLADVSRDYSENLHESLLDIVKRYAFLKQQETAYQHFAETDYIASKEKIEGSTMSLFDQNN